MNELKVICISGVDCYENDGTVYLKLENVARGLGFTRDKNGKEYVMWDRVEKYLNELDFHTSVEMACQLAGTEITKQLGKTDCRILSPKTSSTALP